MKTRFSTRKLVAISAIATILGLASLAYFFIPSTASITNEPAAATEATAQAAYGKLPLSFEANHGQTDSQVKFLSRGSGYTLFLTGAEAVLSLRAGDKETRRQEDKETKGIRNSQSKIPNPQSSVLRMKLVGANPSPQAAGLGELPGKSNYFIGNDPKQWRTDIPTYGKVKFASVYPGVDVVYYGTQGRQLEYDFFLAPQSDPKAIKLSFEGADKIEVDKQGDLALRMNGKELRMRKPIVYQEKDGVRQEIAGRYTLSGEREVGFEIAAYDAARQLVIDPVLAYSTFLGGTGEDTGIEIAVNAHGDAFATGLTTSPDFPVTPGTFATTHNGGYDAFVIKFSAEGLPIYSTYLGGSDDENIHGVPQGGGIAIDASDNAYVTGLTKSSNFPVFPDPGALQPAYNGGGADGFVTKLNHDGSALIYSTYLGGPGFDIGHSIAVDSFGQAYVTGYDGSGSIPANGFQTTHSAGCVSGGADGFVAKLNVFGTGLLYYTYFGGNSCNQGFGIAVDADQNAYVTGETSSSNFPTTPGALDATCGTDGACNPVYDPNSNKLQPVSDIFVTKVDTKFAGPGSLKYSTYLGGGKEERFIYSGSVIAVDDAGKFVYLTGLTASADFPVTNGAPLNGPSDAFITKLNILSPTLVYSTYLGGGGGELGTGIAADINGNAYVTGGSGGTFPSTAGMSTCTDPGAFVAKYDAGGKIQYATCISGLGQDTATDIAIDPAGCVYITGGTESYNYPTVNAFQPTFAGGTDATPSDGFVTKLCSGLDHFKCYDVRPQEIFQPFNVILRDQFESQSVTVLRPTTLCNPAIKCVPTGDPKRPFDCNQRLNPDDHLVCYETVDDRGTPQFEPREVIVSNQFGKEQRLTVWRRKNLLCIPSLKAHVDAKH